MRGSSRWDLVGDLSLGILVGAVAVPVHLSESVSAGVAAGLVAAAVCLRRVAPSLMIVLAVASAAIQLLTDQIAVLAALALAVVFYSLGSQPNRGIRLAALPMGVVGSAVAAWRIPHVYAAASGDLGTRSTLGTLFGFTAAAVVLIGGWTVGFIRYQRRVVEQSKVGETIAELERRRIIDLFDEQAERARLSRDMHDVVAHSLAVVIAQAEGARYALDADVDKARSALTAIAGTARSALGDVRSMLVELRPDPFSTTSTRADRAQLIERMTAAGMTVRLVEEGEIDSVASDVASAATRVLTEALTNALKYGDLSVPVDVRQDWTSGCRLVVRNDVSDVPSATGGTGHGIPGMIAHAARVGGTLTSKRDGERWCVEMTVEGEGVGDDSRRADR